MFWYLLWWGKCEVMFKCGDVVGEFLFGFGGGVVVSEECWVVIGMCFECGVEEGEEFGEF